MKLHTLFNGLVNARAYDLDQMRIRREMIRSPR